MHKGATFDSGHAFELLSTQPSPFVGEPKTGRIRIGVNGNGMNSIVTVFLFLDTAPLWEARQRNCGLAYASINAVLDLVVPQNLRLEFMKESVPWTPDLQQHNIALFANVVDGLQGTLHVSSCRNVFLENKLSAGRGLV